eukprot:3547997-Amphidinium_carterae.1
MTFTEPASEQPPNSAPTQKTRGSNLPKASEEHHGCLCGRVTEWTDAAHAPVAESSFGLGVPRKPVAQWSRQTPTHHPVMLVEGSLCRNAVLLEPVAAALRACPMRACACARVLACACVWVCQRASFVGRAH